MFLSILREAASFYNWHLKEEQYEQFDRYCRLLLAANEKMNLTAITAPEEVAIKHMADSLTVYDENIFNNSTNIIDIGTGAGFPGIPIKIYRNDLPLTLLDAQEKRVKFLREVVEELGLKGAECIHGRAEDLAREEKYRERFQIAVSRAVAALPVLAEYALPFVKVGGCFLAMKGLRGKEEAKEGAKAIKTLGGYIDTIREVKLFNLEDKRFIIKITKEKETPKKYPRKAGLPNKKPIV